MTGGWTFLILIVVVAVAASTDENNESKSDLSRGFGDLIDWKKFDEALRLNRDPEDNRPVFVLIHRSTCGACKSIKLTKKHQFTDNRLFK